jgi:hypothetical protein
MNRWLGTFAVFLLCSAIVSADVTVTTTTTVEGGMAAMMGGATPKVVMRIKALKARTDTEAMGRTMSTLTDLEKKEVMVLRPDEKTAIVMDSVIPDKPGAPPVALPQAEGSFEPTGRSQTIDGLKCDEYAVDMTVSMSGMGGNQPMPPQAAEMFKDFKMMVKGSVWVAKAAPGAEEYAAFQKAAIQANLAAILTGGVPGAPTNGFDRVLTKFSSVEGIPYLTEMNVTMAGTGQAAEMMKQMGPMKLTSKVTSVSTDPIAADQFVVPPDYRIVKQ